MPYTPTTWVSGSTPVDAPEQNNLETQYTEATNSIEQDLLTAFTISGMVCTKNGTNAKQLDVTAGVTLIKQTDGTLRRRATSASTTNQFLTATPSTTYFLDLNPDGTFSWGTAHSAVTNHLTVASVTTDASGNINVITDTRTLNATLLASMTGNLSLATAQYVSKTGDTMTGALTAPAFHGPSDSTNAINGGATGPNGGSWAANGDLHIGGLFAKNTGVAFTGISFFSGTGAGTFSHGLGTTPLWVGITDSQGSSTMTVGVDTIGSTTCHVNTGASHTWRGVAVG